MKWLILETPAVGGGDASKRGTGHLRQRKRGTDQSGNAPGRTRTGGRVVQTSTPQKGEIKKEKSQNNGEGGGEWTKDSIFMVAAAKKAQSRRREILEAEKVQWRGQRKRSEKRKEKGKKEGQEQIQRGKVQGDFLVEDQMKGRKGSSSRRAEHGQIP